jgi:hypothetical protein
MKFNNASEALAYYKNKSDNHLSLTEEERLALLEFFSVEALEDMCFETFKVEECFKHHNH